MTGLLVLFSTLTLAQIPDGWQLAERLAAAGTVAHLPLSSLVSTARRLSICYHHDPDAEFVRLVPRVGSLTRAEITDQPLADSCSWSGRKLPGIDFYRPYYAPEGHARAIEDLPVDTASALYTALIRASLDLDGPPRDGLAARAQATMVDVPSAQRQTAFLDASTDFLAHALTVAHEIARHQRRRRARDSTLCGLFDHRDSLFGTWTKVFGSGRYSGIYQDGTAWTTSRSALSIDDRQWLVRTVLGVAWTGVAWTGVAWTGVAWTGVAWTGEASADFAWLCD